MEEITGRMIYRNIRKSYSAFLICAVLMTAVFGTVMWFCVRGLGWLDTCSFTMTLLTAGSLGFMGFSLYKFATVRRHRIFLRYGDPDTLAEMIRAGARNPYFHTLPDRKWGLLITERFIVSEHDLQNYLELADVRVMQFYEIPDEVRPAPDASGSIIEAVLTWLFGRFLQRKYADYRKRHPLPENACTWLLYLWDADGQRYSYQVAPADRDSITAALRELVPDIRMKPMTKQ